MRGKEAIPSLGGEFEKKERCFDIMDSLLDRGIDLRKMGRELEKREYERVRTRLRRVFGSVQQAIFEHGYYKQIGVPTPLELQRCLYIDENYGVKENIGEINQLCDLYNISVQDVRSHLNGIRRDVERDALDEFYRDKFPFDGLTTKVIEEMYPEVHLYIKKFYTNRFVDFVNSYGNSYEIFIERENANNAANLGLIFERKLERILRVIYPDLKTNVSTSDCRPDFALNGNIWIDAKLSYYSIFDDRCKTLEKYLPNCDHLIIYYARFKRDPVFEGDYDVLHVSELYPKLNYLGRNDLIEEMDNFVKGAEAEAMP